jgi:glycosyltransferase involved in cell wall biosynthesis
MGQDDMRVAVAQIGSRMHYAVPRQLEARAMLEHLYTDVCASKGIFKFLRNLPPTILPASVNRLAGRVVKEVPEKKITSFDWIGLKKAYWYSKRNKVQDFTDLNLQHVSDWCKAVAACNPKDASVVYAFNSCALEIFAGERWKSVKKVLEQTIAPIEYEARVLTSANKVFGWGDSMAQYNLPSHARFAQREREEWAIADSIICGSQFVKDSIGEVGGPIDKCIVVPYGVGDSATSQKSKQTPEISRKLRVLFVGAVGLRKGIPIFLEVARRCAAIAEFRVVGKLDNCPTDIEDGLRKSCEVLGVVPRSEMSRHYDWADIFLLPSLCEGSATVTYEAAFHGVPVICTPNTGSTIVDGESGYVVPCMSSDAIIERLQYINANRANLSALSSAALRLSTAQTEREYGSRLAAALLNA